MNLPATQEVARSPVYLDCF